MQNGLQKASRDLKKLFKNRVPKSDEHYVKMGSKMESKWNQDLEKESPELILDAVKASAKKMLQHSHGEVSAKAREPGLCALKEGKK